MLLKSIEVQGFKSFADKTVLKFGQGITAVVGPNGSGKSNISDAIRWVLGEQSTKTLRGHKMEDVIFGGTATRRPLGFAEVTLTIDNSDRGLNFDNDTVSVTRRYYRSGESEYQINKATVLLKNIHELFMDTGLGRDGYSMIGQGKIDSIVGTKSSERRDIFEEAAGISRYRYRKIEAERRLQKADDNILRLKDILKELEERVGPLCEQSKKAEQFLQYSEEKKSLEIGLWLNVLAHAGETLREQEEKIITAKAQYESTEEQFSNIDTENEEILHKTQELSAKIDEVRRLIAKLEEDKTRKEGEIALLNNDIFHNNESIARIKNEIDSVNLSFDRAESDIRNFEAEIEKRESDIAAASAELAGKNEELQNLIFGSEGISRRIEELVVSLNALSAQISDHRVNMVTAQSSLTEIEARGETVEEFIAEAENELEKAENERLALNKDKAELEESITSLRNSLKGYQMREDSRASALNRLKGEIDTLQLDIGEKLRRVKILQDLEQSMEGFSGSVKLIVKESKNGRLPGIHGPVSRLIKVDKKYSVAVEIALAGKIQNIVVDSEGNAKRAIALLKNQRAGRATFLPIATIKGRTLHEKGLEELYGFVGIGSELIECDEKYRQIIENLLGNTVVAEDIDAAVAIAKKYSYRFKVVTLDGQVVNAGGSLTGGSLSKSAGLLSRSGEIERLKNDAEELKKRSDGKTAEYDALAAELAQTRAQINAINGELSTANEDLIRIDGELRRVDDRADSAKANLSQLKSERDGADSRKAELSKTAEFAEKCIAELEKKAEQTQSEIDQATGGRNKLSEDRELLSASVGEIKLRISLLEKDRDNARLSIEQIRLSADSRVSRIAALNGEIDGYNNKNAELENKIEEIGAQGENMLADIVAFNENIAELARKREAFEKRTGELRAKERELSENKEKLGGELARLEERKESMVREHDDIIARLFDEYGLTRSEAMNLGIVIEDKTAAKRRLDELKGKIKRLGNVNVAAIEEYKEVSERYEFLREQLSDVEHSRSELYRLINDLTSQMQTLFVDGFNQVNGHFKSVFTELFGGGKGELQLSDPDNVLESGIEIIVQPPGKKVSSIELLSGGEKALIALSIYFAIMKVNPPPFCMLDEVETALDDINVDRFAQYLHTIGGKTQFICITHRRGTMEEADMLYGVTMQEKGISKLLELNVAELEKNLNLIK